MSVAASQQLHVIFGDAQASSTGFWGRAWRRLRRNRPALIGLAIVIAITLAGVFAPLLQTHDPATQDFSGGVYQGPSGDHLMGTDGLGRDWFSRLLNGARISLAVGVFAQIVVLAIGLPIGLMAGYFGRGTDNLLMRVTDLFYAFPDLLLIILLRGLLGGNLFTLFLIIGLVNWVDMARLIRGQVLSLREREYIEAAQTLGATHRDIMLRHILPNAMGPLIVVVTFGIPRAIFIEASLSFIGFGVSQSTPSWGTMVQEGYQAIFGHPHLVIFPSMAIALLMLAFTFLGDGLRDALDPRTETPVPPRADAQVEPRRAETAEAPAPAEERRAA